MNADDAERVKHDLLEWRKLYDEEKDPAIRERMVRIAQTWKDIFNLNEECLGILKDLREHWETLGKGEG